MRRCWAQRGKRVVVPRQLKYEWGYTYGALDCVSGAAEFLHTNGVSLETRQCFLEQLAASDGEAQHVVIWDQAGFHQRPDDPQLPQNVHLLPLPPYSPELNPIEQLWDITKDVICNQVFATMDALNEKLNEALRPYWEDAKCVLALIGDRYLTVPVNAS
ncbi:MAG: transposase [Chthoniobacteraceae bacterium]